jgi:hypothetical protein
MLLSGAFFSLHCLIYKVHAALSGTFFILPNQLPFVKNFFQLFLTRSRLIFGCCRLAFVLAELVYLTRFSAPCQELFFSLFNTFTLYPFVPPSLADSLVRIPDHDPFVNAFFHLFSVFRIFFTHSPFFRPLVPLCAYFTDVLGVPPLKMVFS